MSYEYIHKHYSDFVLIVHLLSYIISKILAREEIKVSMEVELFGKGFIRYFTFFLILYYVVLVGICDIAFRYSFYLENCWLLFFLVSDFLFIALEIKEPSWVQVDVENPIASKFQKIGSSIQQKWNHHFDAFYKCFISIYPLSRKVFFYYLIIGIILTAIFFPIPFLYHLESDFKEYEDDIEKYHSEMITQKYKSEKCLVSVKRRDYYMPFLIDFNQFLVIENLNDYFIHYTYKEPSIKSALGLYQPSLMKISRNSLHLTAPINCLYEDTVYSKKYLEMQAKGVPNLPKLNIYFCIDKNYKKAYGFERFFYYSFHEITEDSILYKASQGKTIFNSSKYLFEKKCKVDCESTKSLKDIDQDNENCCRPTYIDY